MILLIDNFDSFSYNLYQFMGEINPDIKVVRNDELTIEEIEKLNPEKIVISPGSGKPCDAGICEDVIRHFAPLKPILGICLGHQAICEVFGAKVTYAKEIMHGKTSVISIDLTSPIFKGLPQTIKVARYHSLVADISTIPEELKVIGKTDDDVVMAVSHKKYNVFGLQFHPESILTPNGKIIIRNFIEGIWKW